MKKAILSASGVLSALVCAIISFKMFATTGDGSFALITVLLVFIALTWILWGIENTKVSEFLSNLFTEEGGDDE